MHDTASMVSIPQALGPTMGFYVLMTLTYFIVQARPLLPTFLLTRRSAPFCGKTIKEKCENC